MRALLNPIETCTGVNTYREVGGGMTNQGHGLLFASDLSIWRPKNDAFAS